MRTGIVALFGRVACVTALVAACGGGVPAASVPPASLPPASVAATSDPSAAPASPTGTSTVTLVEFADANDPSAGAQSEFELAREMREDAGMAALIGADSAAVIATLDAIEEEFAQALIADVAAAIDAGGIPTESGMDGKFASIDQISMPGSGALNAIDISLFANTGFTASTFMTMLAGVVQQAATSQNGTLPRQESYDRTENGIRQQVDLGTSIVIQTGGGRVSADVIMNATDRISNAASGSFIALYTSRSSGHFDVSACPDDQGVAEGTYTFESKHEMSDVSTATAALSGANRAVEAPFRLIDGDDAHLLRIEAALDLTADAHGNGYDWSAAQQVQIGMPVAGTTTATGLGYTVTGTGGEHASGTMFFSSAMAQLFMKEVGKEAEKFWRSGECIEIKSNEELRKVDPEEEVSLTIDAVHRFDGAQVEGPVVATLTGVDSIDPSQDDAPAAEFTYTAGAEPDEKGTIEFKQITKRGIGKKTIEFTVSPGYRIAMDGELGIDPQNHSNITVSEQEMVPQDDGTFVLETNASVSGTHGIPGCVESFTSDLPIRIEVRPSEDGETANVRVALQGGTGLLSFPLTCGGTMTLSPVPLGLWAGSFLTPTGPGATVTVDEPTTWIGPAGGTSTVINLTTAD